jgi:aspartyl-tRNA(Asn)/glutamyl-tRNA(Gln) amidotransferase subunit B
MPSEPFAKNGSITLYAHDGIAPQDGPSVTIGIKQIQLEQDTAKTLAQPPSLHLLDFNRVSHPLIEIITLPQIHHPATAAALVRNIQARLRAVDAVTAGMEQGGLRADVNVSVRPRDAAAASATGPTHTYAGVAGLGTRTEIKNLSSFKSIEDAIRAERDRQIGVLAAGGIIAGETRGWSVGATETRKLRGKEGEVDYRYMPDPDLGPVVVSPELVEALRRDLPALPDATVEALGVSRKDGKTMVDLDAGERIEYFHERVNNQLQRLGADADEARIRKSVINWRVHASLLRETLCK